MGNCRKVTSGGKGNLNKFIERNPRICAAGVPTGQSTLNLADSLQYYQLQDEVDALLSDAIGPPPKPRPQPPLRKPIPQDTRHAGCHSEAAELLRPPMKSKFQSIIDDVKETSYASYWKAPLGKYRDPVPTLPPGCDLLQTFGKKYPPHDSVYEIVFPKVPGPDTKKREPSIQTNRNYCVPFDPKLTYGKFNNIDKQGSCMKQCLKDPKFVVGEGQRIALNSIKANFEDTKIPRLGRCLMPNKNIKSVPEGFTFGVVALVDSIPECLSYCELNPAKALYAKCLKHLNTVRICNRKKFSRSFYHLFYLNIKYLDKKDRGWLPKQIVYDLAHARRINFDHKLIEPLLHLWNAFDGENVEYKTFVLIMNDMEPVPTLPKIEDMAGECLNFETTYQDMVKLRGSDLSLMAGIPSGRYFDKDYPVTPTKCCRADRALLPEESDMRSCLYPSVVTNFHLSHRDFYEKREPPEVRRVFEATGDKFTDVQFDELWKEAQKLHSQGWVCYETFRKVLRKSKEKL